jgi:hypothetical protein
LHGKPESGAEQSAPVMTGRIDPWMKIAYPAQPVEEITHGCELRLALEPNFLLGSFATANGPAETCCISEIVNKGTKSRSVCCSRVLSRMGGTDAQNGYEMHIAMGDN